MLVACIAALIVFYRGIPVKFSLTIIILVMIVNISYILVDLFSPTSILWLTVLVVFDSFVQLQVPINIVFTERQWVAFKGYNLSLATDS